MNYKIETDFQQISFIWQKMQESSSEKKWRTCTMSRRSNFASAAHFCRFLSNKRAAGRIQHVSDPLKLRHVHLFQFQRKSVTLSISENGRIFLHTIVAFFKQLSTAMRSAQPRFSSLSPHICIDSIASFMVKLKVSPNRASCIEVCKLLGQL